MSTTAAAVPTYEVDAIVEAVRRRDLTQLRGFVDQYGIGIGNLMSSAGDTPIRAALVYNRPKCFAVLTANGTVAPRRVPILESHRVKFRFDLGFGSCPNTEKLTARDRLNLRRQMIRNRLVHSKALEGPTDAPRQCRRRTFKLKPGFSRQPPQLPGKNRQAVRTTLSTIRELDCTPEYLVDHNDHDSQDVEMTADREFMPPHHLTLGHFLPEGLRPPSLSATAADDEDAHPVFAMSEADFPPLQASSSVADMGAGYASASDRDDVSTCSSWEYLSELSADDQWEMLDFLRECGMSEPRSYLEALLAGQSR